ncbi:MAG: radical SAM protein, partial [Clostridia bacterium]|nr:radical SAM protein [Clostridia bacterium]
QLLDGVVLSGGEPTLQRDLPEVLRRIRGMGYKTKLDTNGQRPGAVISLWEAGLLDYVALDMKALAADYPSVTGQDGSAAIKTAKALQWASAAYELRTTLYPGFTIAQLQELLAAFPPVPRWRLNYFRPPELFRPQDAPLLRRPALTPAAIAAAKSSLVCVQPNLLF